MRRLSEVIEAKRSGVDATLGAGKPGAGAAGAGAGAGAAAPAATDSPAAARHGLWTVGLVPCPVRVPIMEQLSSFAESFTAETGRDVSYELKAAYTGTAWIAEHVTPGAGVDDLPDVFLSAGYKLFFTHPAILGLKAEGAFADRRGFERLNHFAESSGLRDPEGHYSVIGVVPAIFLVNSSELGDRPRPRSWEDLLDPKSFFDGEIDEVAIFHRALSEDEIETMYRMGHPN